MQVSQQVATALLLHLDRSKLPETNQDITWKNLWMTVYSSTNWRPPHHHHYHTLSRIFENEAVWVTLTNRDCWTGLTAHFLATDCEKSSCFLCFLRSEQQHQGLTQWVRIREWHQKLSHRVLIRLHPPSTTTHPFECYLIRCLTGHCSCFLCVPSERWYKAFLWLFYKPTFCFLIAKIWGYSWLRMIFFFSCCAMNNLCQWFSCFSILTPLSSFWHSQALFLSLSTTAILWDITGSCPGICDINTSEKLCK